MDDQYSDEHPYKDPNVRPPDEEENEGLRFCKDCKHFMPYEESDGDAFYALARCAASTRSETTRCYVSGFIKTEMVTRLCTVVNPNGNCDMFRQAEEDVEKELRTPLGAIAKIWRGY